MSGLDVEEVKETEESFMDKLVNGIKKHWKMILIVVMCLVVVIVIVVVVQIKKKKKSGPDKLSEGTDKESFMMLDDNTSEFAYVKSYLNSSMGGDLD